MIDKETYFILTLSDLQVSEAVCDYLLKHHPEYENRIFGMSGSVRIELMKNPVTMMISKTASEKLKLW